MIFVPAAIVVLRSLVNRRFKKFRPLCYLQQDEGQRWFTVETKILFFLSPSSVMSGYKLRKGKRKQWHLLKMFKHMKRQQVSMSALSEVTDESESVCVFSPEQHEAGRSVRLLIWISSS